MSGNNGRYRMTRYERDLAEFNKYFDIEIFALELEYNEELGKAIREAVRKQSDQKQVEFDRWLENHPDTITERERWKKNREEMERRMARPNRVPQRIPAQRAARQLARRWGVTLVS